MTAPVRWATWNSVYSWCGSGYGDPVYYDYGTNVIYQNENVYVDGQQIASAEDFAQEALDIAETGSKAIQQAQQDQTADKLEWLPLGVYSLSSRENEANPHLFLQLAVTKEGIIGGTLHNSLTNETKAVEGLIDPTTQRAAISVVGKPDAVLETGIQNLTLDHTKALLHFGTNRTQTWHLERAGDPTESK